MEVSITYWAEKDSQMVAGYLEENLYNSVNFEHCIYRALWTAE